MIFFDYNILLYTQIYTILLHIIIIIIIYNYYYEDDSNPVTERPNRIRLL